MNVAAPIRTLLVAGAAAGLVAAAAHTDVSADFGRASDQAALADRASAAVQSVQVCPGPDRPGAPGFEEAKQKVTVATAYAPDDLVQRAATAGELSIDSAPTGLEPVTAADRRAADPVTVDRAVSPVLTGTGRSALGLAATQVAVDDEKTVAGLAATPCAAPTHEAWIPLGGNQVGRLDRVVLSNPSSTPITVDATVVGQDGPVADKGAAGVVVAAHDRKVVSIGDFDASLGQAMLHVRSTGGPVAVAVADVLMMGERRAGESLAGPTASPALSQTIPAFVVAAGNPDVRVAVPGHDDATVRVQAFDTSGNVVADEVRDVTAGSATAVPLTGAPRGTYSVRVTADVPVVAAGLAVTGTTGTTDLAWATASDPIADLGGLALPNLPSGVHATLMIAPNDRTQQLTVVVGDRRQQVRVPADRPVELDVTDANAVWIRSRSGGPVNAGVVLRGTSGSDAKSRADLLEVLPVQPVQTAASVRDVTADVD